MKRGTRLRVTALRMIAAIAPMALVGCDPILSIDGAFFPAWLICMIAAGFMLAGIRWLVHRAGIEPFIGPRVPVYFCVYLTCTLALWLGFFRL
jgi:hypothetical protein